MNDAAEIAIRFYLGTCEISPTDIDGIIERLASGLEAGDAEARETRDLFLAAALKKAEGTADADMISRAVNLHVRIEQLEGDIAALEKLQKIARIIETRKPGPFGDRIAQAKVREYVQSL